MSIAAATRRAYDVELRAADPSAELASAQSDVDSAIERISGWIPTEAVGCYVALLGVLTPDSARDRWLLLIAGIVLVAVFLLLNAALVHKRAVERWKAAGSAGEKPPGLSAGRLAALLFISLLAFLLWAGALPGSPFLDWWSDATLLFGVLVIPVSAILPKVAELLDLELPRP